MERRSLLPCLDVCDAVGVMLGRLRRLDEALSWMDEAIKLNDTDTAMLQGAGATALAAGLWLSK